MKISPKLIIFAAIAAIFIVTAFEVPWVTTNTKETANISQSKEVLIDEIDDFQKTESVVMRLEEEKVSEVQEEQASESGPELEGFSGIDAELDTILDSM